MPPHPTWHGPWTTPNPWIEAGHWDGDDGDWIWDDEATGCTTANYVAIIIAMMSLFISCVAVLRSDRPRNVVVVSEKPCMDETS